MKQLIILAALFAIALASFTEQDYQDEFTNWMIKHGKIYTSADFLSRFNIFKTNMDFVKQWNTQNSDTVLGHNHLADITNDEYRRVYLGYRDTTHNTRWTWPTAAPPTTTPVTPTSAPVTPTSAPVAPTAGLNWATKGAVTGIKNQGQCGGCWSFSATGATEAAYFLKTGKLVSLSEQNLIDCSSSYGNGGCNGGDMSAAFRYIVANKGIDTEASYPYKAVTGTTCQYNAANLGATLTSYTSVTSGSESALLTAVTARPVSVAIDASHSSFQMYSSGVYYEAACSSTSLDHGVLVVGYGTSGSNDYWIVKNSWGTSWGQAGYIWMARNKSNNCGIATRASYPTA